MSFSGGDIIWMSNTEQAPEPTMDEILSSIRRIISDEPTKEEVDDKPSRVASDIAKALSGDADSADETSPTVDSMDDDILELTDIVKEDPKVKAEQPLNNEATPSLAENNELLDSLSRDINNIQNTLNGNTDKQDTVPELNIPELPGAENSESATQSDTQSFDNITEALSLGNEATDPVLDMSNETAEQEQANQDVSPESALVDALSAGLKQEFPSANVEAELSIAEEQKSEDPISPEKLDNIAEALGNTDELAVGDELTFGELSPEDQLDNIILDKEEEQPEHVLNDTQEALTPSQTFNLAEEANLNTDTLEKISPEQSPLSQEAEDPIVPEAIENTEENAKKQPEEEVEQKIDAPDLNAISEVTVNELSPKVTEAIPVQSSANNSLEDSIKDMLKPMLRQWLDDNMPRLLEDAIKEQRKIEDKS